MKYTFPATPDSTTHMIDSIHAFVLSKKDNKIMLLSQREVLQWIFEDASFLVEPGFSCSTKKEYEKNMKKKEDEWGQNIMTGWKTDAKSQWTTKLTETIAEEIYILLGTPLEKAVFRYDTRNKKQLRPDFESDTHIVEVKGGTWFTTGTAYQKIFGASRHYINVPEIYGKKTTIFCIADAERKCRENFIFNPQNEQEKAWDALNKTIGIEYVAATDVLKDLYKIEFNETCIEEEMTLLKWVGGKTQLLPKLLPIFPTNIRDYYEPFLGGGSVLFAVLESDTIRVSGKIYASDINKYLINFYQCVQLDSQTVWTHFKELVDEYSSCTELKGDKKERTSKEGFYYWVRGEYNTVPLDKEPYRLAAMLLFLNKTCFRGLYREGPNGFNVPFGNYDSAPNITLDDLQHMSTLIQRVVFTCCPYTDVLSRPFETGDFVYMDPPYIPENATSFVSYTKDVFDHDAFICACLSIENATFVMSNSNAPVLQEKFSAYNRKLVDCRRAIHSKNPGATTKEMIISPAI